MAARASYLGDPDSESRGTISLQSICVIHMSLARQVGVSTRVQREAALSYISYTSFRSSGPVPVKKAI